MRHTLHTDDQGNRAAMGARVLILVGAVLVATSLIGACSGTPTSDGSQGAAASSPAGASARDIALTHQMIAHHRQGIEMSELALEKAGALDVLALATRIKEARGGEIATLTAWLDGWGAQGQGSGTPSRPTPEGTTPPGLTSNDDMAALRKAVGPNFDRLWLRLMIAHDDAARSLAERAKAISADARVTTLADTIIDETRTEITLMQRVLND